MTYLFMALDAGGHSEFTFPLSSAKKYGISESSFNRHVKELIQKNFIVLVYSGRTTREPNKYRFTYGWKGVN
jgi:DNA-binding MarR family transcriptional regulator